MEVSVEIMSRKAITQLISAGFPENTAVISFFDPASRRTPADYGPVDYRGVCDRVFSVGIHDIDIEILGDYGLTFDTYFPEADSLADFITKAVADGCNIICQCEYGQSRSAACAAAIKEFFDHTGIEVFADYRYYPNQLVFNKLLSALKGKASC